MNQRECAGRARGVRGHHEGRVLQECSTAVAVLMGDRHFSYVNGVLQSSRVARDNTEWASLTHAGEAEMLSGL